MISAKIVADSLAPCGKRLITYVLIYPRFVHSEVMTHRAFSRNAASSRAIPISRMIRAVLKEPAMPVSWGANGKGMQAKRELNRSRVRVAKAVWVGASIISCGVAWLLSKLGVHKQLANRVMEPFAHMTTLVTATEFENFFALRAHPDAQPEFQELARLMLREYLESEPKVLKAGEWHLPFADKYVSDGLLGVEDLLKISTARAARVSYLNFEGDISYAKDFKLHDDLLASGHMSPFEHAGRAEGTWVRSGNFVGWTQYSHTIPNESRKLTLDEMRNLLNKGASQ